MSTKINQASLERSYTTAIESLIGRFEQAALQFHRLHHRTIEFVKPDLAIGGDRAGWPASTVQDSALNALGETAFCSADRNDLLSHDLVHWRDDSGRSPHGMIHVRSIFISSEHDDEHRDFRTYMQLADEAIRLVRSINKMRKIEAGYFDPGITGSLEQPTVHEWAVGVMRWAIAEPGLVSIDPREPKMMGGKAEVSTNGRDPEPLLINVRGTIRQMTLPYILFVGQGWRPIAKALAIDSVRNADLTTGCNFGYPVGPEAFDLLATALVGAESFTLKTNPFTASAHALRWTLANAKPRIAARKRGRPTDTDSARDQRIADAWNGGHGQFRTKAELAAALDLSTSEVRLALDRHRKRTQSRNN